MAGDPDKGMRRCHSVVIPSGCRADRPRLPRSNTAERRRSLSLSPVRVRRASTRGKIVPVQPAASKIRRDGKKAASRQALRALSFRQAYGRLGLPMLLAALISLAWTTWVISATIAPNETANFLMGSGDWDDGYFWLVPDKISTLQALSAAGFVVVDLGYVYILLKMTLWRSGDQMWIDRSVRMCVDAVVPNLPGSLYIGRAYGTVLQFWRELTGYRGVYRKFWNLCLKTVDIVMQATVLKSMLDVGAPLRFVYGYTAFVGINACFYAASLVWPSHSALVEVLIDSAFDLFSAVGIPILVLVNAYFSFQFDRESYQIYLQVLPPGSSERRARLQADPSEIAGFRASFDALRVQTVPDLIVRIGMNLAFCYRFKRILDELVRAKRVRLESKERVVDVHRPVPKFFAAFFYVFAIFAAYFVRRCVQSSENVCREFPECVSYTYRWHQDGFCPCITMIDTDRAPKTFDEWVNPVDVSLKVKALASTGHLRNLQLINRRLLQIPDELRGCRGMQVLFIMHSGTLSFPSWINEFQSLEYLQIDGKIGDRNLVSIPPEIFDNMPSLMYLQISVHLQLSELPPLNGIPNLRRLVVARMFSLHTLPSFDNLAKLKRLELGYVPVLRSIPDMAPLRQLIMMSLIRPSNVCCNGFLRACNLSDPFCHAAPAIQVPAATCLNDSSLVATPATIATFQRFASRVCQPNNPDYAADFPTRERSDICGGVAYRQCHIGNVTGICYNVRMQVLSCTIEPNKIALRKLQIKQRAGLPCDPIEEEWLGCSTS